jgi:hypothetical protein
VVINNSGFAVLVGLTLSGSRWTSSKRAILIAQR